MYRTKGQGCIRAILYARVSTEEQASSGYSLAQQLEVLREYAARILARAAAGIGANYVQ
jgi:DNA invertase Pin-like site-specific DNA recombinase